MRTVELSALKEHIANHEIRPHLEPLLRFRGQLSIHRAHAMWNFSHAMLMSECDSLLEGVKLYSGSEVGHLCGMHAMTMSRYSIGAFLNRIRQTPKVAAITPGLADYADWVNPYRFDLQVIGKGLVRHSHNHRVLKKINQQIGKSADCFYPFLSNSSTDDHQLLMQVHRAVPPSVHHTIRDDLCQDLVCAVLAGHLKLENLADAVPEFLQTWQAMRPRSADLYYNGNWTPAMGGGRNHANAWKEQYVAADLEHRSFATQVAGLQKHWGCEEVDVSIEIRPKKAAETLPDDWFEQLKRIYPQRRGDHGWAAVRSLVPQALIRSSWPQILSGTENYRKHCDETELTGTVYVKQARTFFGGNRYFEEWADMAPVETPKARIEKARWAALAARAGRIAFREPEPVESADIYETALRFAEREFRGAQQMASPAQDAAKRMQ